MASADSIVQIEQFEICVRPFRLLLIALCLFLVGCTRSQLIKKLTPPEDEAYARTYADLLRRRSFGQVQAALDPRVVDADLRGTLDKMAGLFPAGEPKSVKVVGFSWNFRQVPRTDSLTREYEFPDNRWVLVDLSIAKGSGSTAITAFHVTPISQSPEYTNRFTLAGKGFLQYTVLVLAVAAAIFSFCVFIVCVRIKPLKRKWLWAVFVLVGFGKIGVNGTTGELNITPLAFNIPCAGGSTLGVYGPWVVSVFPPLGAVIFLTKRRDSLKATQPQADADELPPQPVSDPTSSGTQQSGA